LTHTAESRFAQLTFPYDVCGDCDLPTVGKGKNACVERCFRRSELQVQGTGEEQGSQDECESEREVHAHKVGGGGCKCQTGDDPPGYGPPRMRSGEDTRGMR
jgi:hypothetical protein